MSRNWRRKSLTVVVHCVAPPPQLFDFFGCVSRQTSRAGVIQVGFKLWSAFCLITMCIESSITQAVSNTSEVQNLTIGFLSSFRYNYGPGKLICGAMTIAVEDVNNSSDLLPGYKLNFIFGDTGEPQTDGAIRKMTELRDDHDIVAFIGPDHTCDSEALVAAAWNLPMITYNCRDQKVSNKKIYPTFARTIPPSKMVCKSLVALLQHFKWNKFVLIVSNSTMDLQAEESLKLLIRNRSIEIIKRYDLPANYVSDSIDYIKGSIDNSYKDTRVYVLLADDDVLIDFVREMYNRSLLNRGEYVIILVEEQYLYDARNRYQFLRKVHEASLFSKVDPTPFQNVLIITPYSEKYEDFNQKVRNYSAKPPFRIPNHPIILVKVPYHAAFLYDAVMIYARAATEELEANGSIRNGTNVFQHIKNTRYTSVLGYSVRIDENGDAEGNFTLLSLQDCLNANQRCILPIGTFTAKEGALLPELKLFRNINWTGSDPPVAEPECGFKNENCNLDWKMAVICSVSAIVFFIASGFAFRHYSFEHKLACLLWKVDMKDVVLLKSNANTTVRNGRIFKNIQVFGRSRFSSFKDQDEVDPETGRLLSKLGFYKGNIVYIKPVYKRNIDLTRSLRMEMIRIREMRQENINPFIGACVNYPNISILTIFCARGSLMDVLKNDDISLDSVFVASLVADLIKGMCYIHESEMAYHGNLKSTNCLVDSRWVLQITDFGLHEFKSDQYLPTEEREKLFKGLIWRAPELLRNLSPPSKGSQRGDIYSFGIILHEILGRKGPWGLSTLSPEVVEDVIDKVINPQSHLGKLHRPSLQDLDCPDFVKRCMGDCWHEDPDVRPDFRFIGIMLREMLLEVKTNILDNMIANMEKYACNLEELVEERTHLLMEEKKKTENLLLRMLPKPVAEQLKRGERVEAESFDCVTIYFSDIVGFTALSAVSTPLEVVDLLNGLYTCFDSTIGNHDVYKVETIGDAYMVVSGLPIRNGDSHAVHIASMALHLLCAIKNFKIPHRPEDRLNLRIGIHSGPCVAGVVGHKMPRYCLFGDTVNTASRMESTGEAQKIHVSSACKEILDKFGDFELEERGLTQVKGKGVMLTYWILGKKMAHGQKCPGDVGNTEPSSLYTATNSLCNPDVQTCESPGAVTPPSSELSLLLGNGDINRTSDSNVQKKRMTCINSYRSCFNVYHEYKNTIRGLTRDGRSLDMGYRSTPMISLNGFSPRRSLRGRKSLEMT